jgi:hypothetical protein
VIYGAPCQIVAAGTDRNLVQGAVVKRYGKDGRPERSEIDTIERILDFGQPLDRIKKDKEEELDEKRISQAGIIPLSKDCKQMQTLKRLLDFGNL